MLLLFLMLHLLTANHKFIISFLKTRLPGLNLRNLANLSWPSKFHRLLSPYWEAIKSLIHISEAGPVAHLACHSRTARALTPPLRFRQHLASNRDNIHSNNNNLINSYHKVNNRKPHKCQIP